MNEQEGVIKYRLDYQTTPARMVAGFAELNAWRCVLWRLGIIGQDDARYDGLGYGNISLRLGTSGFLITGTQTGHLQQLTLDHYAYVREACPEDNYLRAEGPLPPSSEALTHGAIYGVSSKANCVIHGHSPEIWQNAETMDVPCVAKEIAYGTPAMAKVVSAIAEKNPATGIIVMLGHQDGVMTYGSSPEEASWVVTRYLARAFTILHSKGQRAGMPVINIKGY